MILILRYVPLGGVRLQYHCNEDVGGGGGKGDIDIVAVPRVTNWLHFEEGGNDFDTWYCGCTTAVNVVCFLGGMVHTRPEEQVWQSKQIFFVQSSVFVVRQQDEVASMGRGRVGEGGSKLRCLGRDGSFGNVSWGLVIRVMLDFCFFRAC